MALLSTMRLRLAVRRGDGAILLAADPVDHARASTAPWSHRLPTARPPHRQRRRTEAIW